MKPADRQEPTLADVQRHYGVRSFSAAAEAGWQLLRADPQDATVLNLLALAEHRRGNHHAAVVLLERAVKARPKDHVLWNDLGNVYCAAGAMGNAEAAYRAALERNSQCAEAYNNLGVLSLKTHDFATARMDFDRALAISPDYPDALYNLGNALAAMGKFKKALQRYEQAATLRPEHPGTHFNLAITRLVLGDMAGGWPEWEWRWRSTLAPFERDFHKPAWTGAPLCGKRILLYAEQGIGDTLQFLRYVPMVAACGGKIVLEVQEPLVPLLKDHPDTVIVVARGAELPQFDTHCSLMSLAMIFRTTLATIPLPHSFRGVGPGAELVVSCESSHIRRVGMVWGGNPTHERDRDRSLPLSVLAPLLQVPGVKWFSLQKGESAAALAVTPAFGGVRDLGAAFANFADTAEAVRSLDLIITADTSVAHLAGTMGKPVWILLPAVPDWRWLLRRHSSPWYPSARLFRQDKAGDWAGVVKIVAKELAVFTPASRTGASTHAGAIPDPAWPSNVTVDV